ncbi:hypothetical protein BJ165DRAFT_1524288 [Panaeolus papilionaceus]|nr:hypothetical protein BJ165DRAFT_1524288 [Panaeolus papilionaceus]
MSSDPQDRLSVIVDSFSPSIHYEGPWEQAPPTKEMMNMTRFNTQPFSDVLFMAPKGKNVSLTHKFNGTRIQVQGTFINPYAENRWKVSCTIDGQDQEAAFDWEWQGNQQTFCEGRYLSPSNPHFLNFTVEVFEDQYIWFDRLMVSPTPVNDTNYPLVKVEHTDPMISYDKSWIDFLTGHYTNTTNAKVAINFNGTALRWYNTYEASFSADRSQTRGTMRIDDSDAMTPPFTIPLVEPHVEVQLGDRLFRTPDLSPGPHRVEVTYEVIGRPLGLYYLVVENTAANVPPNPTGGNLPATPIGPSGLSKEAKIGIGVGVSVAPILILLGLLLLYKRRQHQDQDAKEESAHPFYPEFFYSRQPRQTTPPPPGSPHPSGTKGTHLSHLPSPLRAFHIHSVDHIMTDSDETPPPYNSERGGTNAKT